MTVTPYSRGTPDERRTRANVELHGRAVRVPGAVPRARRPHPRPEGGRLRCSDRSRDRGVPPPLGRGGGDLGPRGGDLVRRGLRAPPGAQGRQVDAPARGAGRGRHPRRLPGSPLRPEPRARRLPQDGRGVRHAVPHADAPLHSSSGHCRHTPALGGGDGSAAIDAKHARAETRRAAIAPAEGVRARRSVHRRVSISHT